MVLDCFKALNDPDLSPVERVYAALIIFYEDLDDLDDISANTDILESLEKEMFVFFNGGPEDLSSNTNDYRVIDWDKDSNLICSAINNVSKQEIRGLDYLHWWTFLGYYMAIGDCLLSQVVSIRYKLAKNEKLEKYEMKFKQENSHFFDIDMRSTEQKQADDYIKQLWGED